jgi:hypothetical protein
MARLRCNACGGTYEDVDAAGAPYFHKCARLSDAELKVQLALPVDDALLSSAQHAQLEAAPRARPNARDENPTTPRIGGTVTMKSSGAGVTTL